MEYQFTEEDMKKIREAIEWAMQHPVKEEDSRTISEVLEGSNH